MNVADGEESGGMNVADGDESDAMNVEANAAVASGSDDDD
jgi:hypothetical protein